MPLIDKSEQKPSNRSKDAQKAILAEMEKKKAEFSVLLNSTPVSLGDTLENALYESLRQQSYLSGHLEDYECPLGLRQIIAETVIGPLVHITDIKSLGAALFFAESILACKDISYHTLFKEQISRIALADPFTNNDFFNPESDNQPYHLQIALAHIMSIFTYDYSVFDLYFNKMSLNLIDNNKRQALLEDISQYVLVLTEHIINTMHQLANSLKIDLTTLKAHYLTEEKQAEPNRRWEEIIHRRRHMQKDAELARANATETFRTVEQNIHHFSRARTKREPQDDEPLRKWLQQGIALLTQFSTNPDIISRIWIYSDNWLTERRADLNENLKAQLSRYISLRQDFFILKWSIQHGLPLSFEQISKLRPDNKETLYKLLKDGNFSVPLELFSFAMFDNLKRILEITRTYGKARLDYTSLRNFSGKQLELSLDFITAEENIAELCHTGRKKSRGTYVILGQRLEQGIALLTQFTAMPELYLFKKDLDLIDLLVMNVSADSNKLLKAKIDCFVSLKKDFYIQEEIRRHGLTLSFEQLSNLKVSSKDRLYNLLKSGYFTLPIHLFDLAMLDNLTRLLELEVPQGEYGRIEYKCMRGFSSKKLGLVLERFPNTFLMRHFPERQDSFWSENIIDLLKSDDIVQFGKVANLKRVWRHFGHYRLKELFPAKTLETNWYTPLKNLFQSGDIDLLIFLLTYPNLAQSFIKFSLDKNALKWLFDLPPSARNIFSEELHEQWVTFIKEVSKSPQTIDKERIAFLFSDKHLLKMTSRPIKENPVLMFVLYAKVTVEELNACGPAFLTIPAIECHKRGYCRLSEQRTFKPEILPLLYEVMRLKNGPLPKGFLEILSTPVMIAAYKTKVLSAGYLAKCDLTQLKQWQSSYEKTQAANANGAPNAWNPESTKFLLATTRSQNHTSQTGTARFFRGQPTQQNTDKPTTMGYGSSS
ncbi:hypothetical protein ACFORL_11765 [Legionella dresdenensis]|uniref:RasGEF domain protein n=1 Tax=Legionella dresdenensis TaxID=450200 RepID=A0ABV8CI06_9GAMM